MSNQIAKRIKSLHNAKSPRSYNQSNLTSKISVKQSLYEVAKKYCVEDIPGALIPASRLSNILHNLELDVTISNIAQIFLHNNGLLALFHYAKKEFTFAEFLEAAEKEKLHRHTAAQAKAIKEAADLKIKTEALKIASEAMLAKFKIESEQAAIKKRTFDNDPENIAKVKQFNLRQKYGLSYFIEKTDFVKLMDILRKVDNGVRLSEEEVVWLSTERDEFHTGYFTEELKEGFHKNEAKFYRTEFEKSKDSWLAVNASSHYRKCNQSITAESMLCSIDVNCLKNNKLKSALCTTHGGVKRDLKKWDEALNLGKQAHEFTPQDFRPCTLVGAVYIETGHYDMGQSWYKKAVERGYSEKSVDDELRGIFMRAEKDRQDSLRDYLLNIDPFRYYWVKKNLDKKRGPRS